MNLPPLPKQYADLCGTDNRSLWFRPNVTPDVLEPQSLYTAAQLRAYAEQAVAAERERCARLVETQDTHGDYGVQAWFDLLAGKIRVSA